MTAKVCRAVGLVLLGLGIWGFTADRSFLLFEVNPVHHIVQVVVGAAALWAGCSGERAARRWSLGAACICGFVAVLGFMDVPSVVDLLNLTRADHWLHLLMGGASLAAVLASRSDSQADRSNGQFRPTPTPGG